MSKTKLGKRTANKKVTRSDKKQVCRNKEKCPDLNENGLINYNKFYAK